MAGSNDSGSTPLRIVRSAGGSCRAQLETKRQISKTPQFKKQKRAREQNRRARLKRVMRYFAGAGAAGVLLLASGWAMSKELLGAAGWGVACGIVAGTADCD